MRIPICPAPLVILLALPAAVAQSQSASLSGSVLESSTRQPVVSAIVTATRAGSPPAVTTSTRSGADGAFQFQQLPPGNYTVCVQVRNAAHLNPCEWNAVPPQITLNSAQIVTAFPVYLEKASIVTIRLRDSGNAMTLPAKDGRHPAVSFGVWAPNGLYYPAHSETGSQPPPAMHNAVAIYTYRVAVPRNVPLKLHVDSRDLKLGNADGLPLPANASQQAFQRTASDLDPQDFTFSVLGVLP